MNFNPFDAERLAAMAHSLRGKESAFIEGYRDAWLGDLGELLTGLPLATRQRRWQTIEELMRADAAAESLKGSFDA